MVTESRFGRNSFARIILAFKTGFGEMLISWL